MLWEYTKGTRALSTPPRGSRFKAGFDSHQVEEGTAEVCSALEAVADAELVESKLALGVGRLFARSLRHNLFLDRFRGLLVV